MPRQDREELRLSMTAKEWEDYERMEREIVASVPPAAPMTSPSPAAPAPAPSLADAAREAADYLVSAALTVRCLRDGDELADRLGQVESRVRSALSAESERERLRREAAEAFLRWEQDREASFPTMAMIEAFSEWAKMEASR